MKAQFVATAVGTQKGVVMEAYEYQRYQTSSKPFWTPIRFAGQYYDAESDLAENWNRFYDSNIGRYVETDPVLSRPVTQVQPYSYAGSNPLGATDRTGNFQLSWFSTCPTFDAAEAMAENWAGCNEQGSCSTKCHKAIAACTGDCDVCQYLRNHQGPTVYTDDGVSEQNLGPVTRGTPDFFNPTGLIPMDPRGGRAAQTPVGNFIFNHELCYEWDRVADLASTMVHEASHACGAVDYPKNSIAGCSAQDLESACLPGKP